MSCHPGWDRQAGALWISGRAQRGGRGGGCAGGHGAVPLLTTPDAALGSNAGAQPSVPERSVHEPSAVGRPDAL